MTPSGSSSARLAPGGDSSAIAAAASGAGSPEGPLDLPAVQQAIRTALDAGDPQHAMRVAWTLLQAHPEAPDAHRSAADCLLAVGERAQAAHHLRLVVELLDRAPGPGPAAPRAKAEALATLGYVLRDLEEAAESARCFERALATDASHIDARLGLLRLRWEAGEDVTTDADALLRAHPRVPGVAAAVADWRLAQGDPEGALAALEPAIGTPALPERTKAALRLQEAHIHDARGDLAAAWRSASTGNAALRGRFDDAAHLAEMHAIMRAWPVRDGSRSGPLLGPRPELRSDPRPELRSGSGRGDLADRPALTDPPPGVPRLVVIAGLPRSGTSLLEQMIARHPAVRAMGEADLVARLVGRIESLIGRPGPWVELAAELAPDEREALAGWLRDELVSAADGAPVVTEKSVRNTNFIGLVTAVLPEAVIVPIERDPLDVGRSCWFAHFTGHHPWIHDLRSIGVVLRRHAALVEHWRRVVPDRLLPVRYEDLVRAPDTVMHRLLPACGLTFDPRCLEPHRSGRVVRTSSRDQVRRPIGPHAIGKAARDGRRLDRLRAALAEDDPPRPDASAAPAA